MNMNGGIWLRINSAVACAICVMAIGCSVDDSDPNAYCEYFDTNGVVELQNGDLVEYHNGKVLYQGDIELSSWQYDNLKETGDIFANDTLKPAYQGDVNPVTNLPTGTSTHNVGVNNRSLLWAMMRFTYDDNLSPYQRECIKAALLRIQSNTNVRFYNATGLPTHNDEYNIDYPYVNFKYKDDDVSSSHVGVAGGKQDICLNDSAFVYGNTYVIEHEICHALGMYHEQSRPDRDNYVTINTSNLTDRGKANFVKAKNYTTRGSYDFSSVMGYGSFTTSTSMVNDTSKPMYTKKDGSYIDQGKCLSDGDRMWLNYYYLPYVARSDSYLELDSVVYSAYNVKLSEKERLKLQAKLNGGKSTPPAGGRIKNDF